VLAAALMADPSVQLEDLSAQLPLLRRLPGLDHWRVWLPDSPPPPAPAAPSGSRHINTGGAAPAAEAAPSPRAAAPGGSWYSHAAEVPAELTQAFHVPPTAFPPTGAAFASSRLAEAGGVRRDLHLEVRRPLRPFRRPVLADIYLCNACSCQEILRRNGRGQRAWRLLPHHQDSGGFFVAAFRRSAPAVTQPPRPIGLPKLSRKARRRQRDSSAAAAAGGGGGGGGYQRVDSACPAVSEALSFYGLAPSFPRARLVRAPVREARGALLLLSGRAASMALQSSAGGGGLRVSAFLAWIRSPCLRHCVHGAPISTGGGGGRAHLRAY
jgi:hypothetical protein